MSLRVLEISQILHPGQACQISRATLTSARPKALHSHDFHELLWVQNGTLRHHTPEGIKALGEGTLIFMRPGDRHALQGRGDQTMVVSLSISPEALAPLPLEDSDLSDRYFWCDAPCPVVVTRDSRQLAALNQAALQLERRGGSARALRAFLLPLLADLLEDELPLPADAPDWLATACRAAQQPSVFRDGAAGFVAVTGRAHAHVSRTARAVLGQTPTDYVNTIRMAHAARALTGSRDTLAEIAAEVGLPNLSHFHKLFQAHYGTTPAQYRKARQRDVVQPE